MPHLVDQHGLDTALARLLLDRGDLDVRTLQDLLAEARQERPQGGTLARSILRRSLLDPGRLEAAMTQLQARAHGWREGAQVGEHRLLRRLGAGGMGVVFLAEHSTGGQRAIKTLPHTADPHLLERFRREAQAQAAVDAHPNVVRVHSFGEAYGQLYLVLGYAEGGDLEERLKSGPLALEDAVTLVRDLCRGLAHVHSRGVLHRDLKAANVLFDEHGTPMLVDFGLAQVSWEGSLTATGDLMGTPAAMAPEQARGEKTVDERTDVYGMGALLYRCLTGAYPFQGGSVLMTLAAVCEGKVRPPSALRSEIPASLDSICLRAMAREPKDRYPGAAALADALEEYLRGDDSSRRPKALLIAAASGVAALALLGLVLFSPGLFSAPSKEDPVAAVPVTPAADVDTAKAVPEASEPIAKGDLDRVVQNLAPNPKSARAHLAGLLPRLSPQQSQSMLRAVRERLDAIAREEQATFATVSSKTLRDEVHLHCMRIDLDPAYYAGSDALQRWIIALSRQRGPPRPILEDMLLAQPAGQIHEWWRRTTHATKPGRRFVADEQHIAFLWRIYERARGGGEEGAKAVPQLLRHLAGDLDRRLEVLDESAPEIAGLQRVLSACQDVASRYQGAMLDTVHAAEGAAFEALCDHEVRSSKRMTATNWERVLALSGRGLAVEPKNTTNLIHHFKAAQELGDDEEARAAALAFLNVTGKVRREVNAQRGQWSDMAKLSLRRAREGAWDVRHVAEAIWPFPAGCGNETDVVLQTAWALATTTDHDGLRAMLELLEGRISADLRFTIESGSIGSAGRSLDVLLKERGL